MGISGTYVQSSGNFRWEVRLDLDGPASLNLVSGDLFGVAPDGGGRQWLGSFRMAQAAAPPNSAPGAFTINGVIECQPPGFLKPFGLPAEAAPLTLIAVASAGAAGA